jgi:hypothetical protein
VKTPGKLQETAIAMRVALQSKEQGAKHQPLPRGLHLVLQRADCCWRLALGREWVYPSETEVTICKAAFNVPEGSEEKRTTKPSRHPSSKRPIIFYVVELTWREETPANEVFQ